MTLMESGEQLKNGDAAPSFSLTGTDGKMHGLPDTAKANALLVVFMCNHCPYVKPKLAELNRIWNDYKDKGLAMVGINSNDPVGYPEDDLAHMQQLVTEGMVSYLYLVDEMQDVAKAYGAVCTPDPFLFLKMRGGFVLVHHGRIDDVHRDQPATRHELHEAIGQLLSTGKIDIPEQPSMGCSIKWRY